MPPHLASPPSGGEEYEEYEELAAPQVGQLAVGIARHELAHRAARRIEPAPAHRADIAAIDVDADRIAASQRVRHLVDVVGRRQHLDLAWTQRRAAALGDRTACRIEHETLRRLRAAQDADQAPDLM